MRTTENELFEMYVKFWEPYAVQVMARDIAVIKRVQVWLPKINGMTVEQLFPYEVRRHRVSRVHVSKLLAIQE